MFNERERLYDEMSELYRKYQDTVSGDLDGSKIEEFWKLLYRAASKMVRIDIGDSTLSIFICLHKNFFIAGVRNSRLQYILVRRVAA